MKTSIIIPHRDRERDLGLCLWSLERAWIFRPADVEIVIANAGKPPEPRCPVTIVQDDGHGNLFNKSRLLNMGIEAASGDVLVFLDADAIVGEEWMETFRWLTEEDAPTKLCYRVKHVPFVEAEPLYDACVGRTEAVAEWFARWGELHLAGEGYGTAHALWWGGKPPNDFDPRFVFGNSQYAIRRDVLGDLRYNENFAGGNFEDVWMNREIARRIPGYRAQIVTEPRKAILHVHRPRTADKPGHPWCDPKVWEANEQRYFKGENVREPAPA